MKKVLIVTAMFCIGVTSCLLAPAAEEDFRPVASEAGDFSVEMPAHPQLLAHGSASHFQVPQYAGAVYDAGYVDLSEDAIAGKEPRAVIKLFRSAIFKGAEITAEEEVEGLTGGGTRVPGLDYIYKKKGADGEYHGHEQAFLMHRRFYLFMVLGSQKAVTSADAEFFFDSIQFSSSPREREVNLELSELPKESQAALAEVAPGIEWEEAQLTKGAHTDDDGKLVETKRIRVVGKDAKRHEVIIIFEPGKKIDETTTHIDFRELPAAVQRTVLTRGETFGEPVFVKAVGPTTTKIERYEFDYRQAGVMTVSPDGKKVETFGLE